MSSLNGWKSERTLVPQVLWLWLPIVLTVLQIVIHAVAPKFYYDYVADSEAALTQNLTPLLLLAAIVMGVLVVRRRRELPSPWLGGWVLLLCLGCFYFAGEEVSWGQVWFNWATPQALAVVNNQGETNLHNVSSWFNEKPRLLVELFVLIGGVFVPLLGRKRFQLDDLNRWWAWFWPTRICIPIAVLISVVKIPDRIDEELLRLPFALIYNGNEAQEVLIANFMLVYLAAIYVRLRRR